MTVLEWCRLRELSEEQLARLVRQSGIQIPEGSDRWWLQDASGEALDTGLVSWDLVDEMEREG